MISRALEETFAAPLTTAFAEANPAVAIRLSNEDPDDHEAIPLPSVILAASESGLDERIRVDGRSATDMELRAICRADATADASGTAAEALASAAQAAIEGASELTGWLFLQLHPQTAERAWEGNVRLITLSWKVVALDAV